MIAEGASQFIVEVENSALKMLQELNFANVQAKWFMDGEKFGELAQKVELAESFGAKKLIITGMKPHDVKKLLRAARLWNRLQILSVLTKKIRRK